MSKLKYNFPTCMVCLQQIQLEVSNNRHAVIMATTQDNKRNLVKVTCNKSWKESRSKWLSPKSLAYCCYFKYFHDYLVVCRLHKFHKKKIIFNQYCRQADDTTFCKEGFRLEGCLDFWLLYHDSINYYL